jgi:quinol monooxygenase YgiN
MYVRIGTFEVSPRQIDAVAEHLRVHAIHAFSGHQGFLGYQAFADRERGRIVGISRWNSRAALEASDVSARQVVTQLAQLGAVLASLPQILEQVFDAEPE